MNEELFYSLIRHQTYLMRYSGGLRNKIFKLLDDVEEDILAKIEYKLKNNKTFEPNKLKILVDQISLIRNESWKLSSVEWVNELTDLAKEHADFLSNSFASHSPLIIAPTLPENNLLKTLVKESPFQGRVLKDWASDLKATDLKRISDQISIGMVQGESGQQISKRVKDVMNISKQNVQAITRTAVNHIANKTSQEFYKQNKDLIKNEIYVATLDGRTTAICKSKDGKIYEVGKGYIPPLHFACRSLRVPTIDGNLYGSRPMKPITDKQLVREFLSKNKIESKAKLRKDLPYGTKTDFDKFAAKRVKEIIGVVPAKQNYQQFLTKQPKWFVDDTLGKTKSKLFREGGLTLDKFVDVNGKELTINQLRSRNRKSFEKAGLTTKTTKTTGLNELKNAIPATRNSNIEYSFSGNKEIVEGLQEYQRGLFNSKVGAFPAMQKRLRTGEILYPEDINPKELDEYINNVKKGFDQSRLVKDQTLNRYIRSKKTDPYFSAKVGDEIIEKGFTSTTRKPSNKIKNKFSSLLNPGEKPTQMIINAKRNQRAIDIDLIKDIGESETLLPSNTKFKITKITEGSIRKMYVDIVD